MSSGNMTRNPVRMRIPYRSCMQGRITLWTKLAVWPVAFQFSSLSIHAQEQRGFPVLLEGKCLWERSSRGKSTKASLLELPPPPLQLKGYGMGESRAWTTAWSLQELRNFGPQALQKWVKMLPWKSLLGLLRSGTPSSKTQKMGVTVHRRFHARST